MQHIFAKLTILALLSTLIAGLASCGGQEKPGLRIVLAPEEGAAVSNLDQALDGAVAVIQRRLEQFEIKGGKVRRDGDQLVVEASAKSNLNGLTSDLTRRGLLEFCEPVTDSAGNVAVVRQGKVRYKSGTCEPVRDGEGNIVVDGGTVRFEPWAFQFALSGGTRGAFANPTSDVIVWEPAAAQIGGVSKPLTGKFLKPNTYVTSNPILKEPILIFEWMGDGGEISKQVTSRLVTRHYPLAPFLDGRPITDSNGLPIAPMVQGVLSVSGQINGLNLEETQHLSKLLNSGVLPVALRVVESREG